MDRDKMFERIVERIIGRAPTVDERALLQRLGASWDVTGNEALLAVLLVFCGSAAKHKSLATSCIESVRRSVERQLSRAVSTPGQRIEARAPTSVGVLAAGWVFIVAVGWAGVALGTSISFRLDVPPAMLTLLRLGCGWAMFATTLLPAALGAISACGRVRGARTPRARAAGWALLAGVNLAMCGWAIVLLTL